VKRVALTGGIGTGKSYVVRKLREAGVPVVDADVLARDAVAPGSPGLAAVAARFGPEVLTPTGELDRRHLGEIVFGDEHARRDLEAIIHPVVRQRMSEFFHGLPADTPVAVADIPLLYETGRERAFDAVIVVACQPETQLQRVMTRDRLSRDAVRRRLAAQMPIADKVRRADYVIRTDGTHAETDSQIHELLRLLQSAADSLGS
jgi:dephospho-CoA kinase